MHTTALVITSIALADSQVLNTYATECKKRAIPFIVIGDTKSPEVFELDGCDFWSLQRQSSLNFKLASIVPSRHYARKNLGYLLAMQNGANTIIETDDDNYPMQSFWNFTNRTSHVQAHDLINQGWVNIYRYFSNQMIWPRGYPLEILQKDNPIIEDFSIREVHCPIQQGLADENPDVDAVFRLTHPLPLNFDKGRNIALGQLTWSPFNSQNTLWFKEAMPLMYLPSYCSFRMTDIWRSFIAQRVAWSNDWSILYHESTVWQERNDHNLLKDFEDEIPGYLNNQKIIDALSEIDLTKGNKHICDNLIKCYDLMIKNGWILNKEAPLVRAWADDISKFI